MAKKEANEKRQRVDKERAAASKELQDQLLQSHLRRQAEWETVGPELTKRDTTRRDRRLKLADEVRAIGEANRKAALGQSEPKAKGPSK